MEIWLFLNQFLYQPTMFFKRISRIKLYEKMVLKKTNQALLLEEIPKGVKVNFTKQKVAMAT
jgi:hypothetical protein